MRSKRWSASAARRSAKLVATGLLHLVAATGRRLGVGAALVRFVDDDEIPALLPDALADVVLLGVVQRCDDLRRTLPRVDELLLVNRREDDLERFAEPP